MIWAATMLTASAITGFTFPGMMLEPGWVAGSSISLKPVREPDVSRRRSLAIFMSPTAIVRSAPESEARQSIELLDRVRCEPRVRIDPDTERRATERQLSDVRPAILHAAKT